VRSITSNSKTTSRPVSWLRIWALGAAIALLFLGGYEAFWRSIGFKPFVNDDADLWSLARSHVRQDDPSEIVLIGASRLQLGVDPQLLGAKLQCRPPVQLAVDGSSCVPVLEHLSRDPRFSGTVLCEVSPWTFFAGIDIAGGKQAEYVWHYEQRTAYAGIEETLRCLMQEHLALRLPDVSLKRAIAHVLHRKPLKPSYIVTLPDRSRRADYGQVDVADLRRYREERTRIAGFGSQPPRFAQDLRQLNEMVVRIKARGGRVIFLVMPTSGTVREVEEQRMPRAVYWDQLIEATGAAGIHPADHPELQFECPEGSHMDYREAKQFTAALAAIVKPLLPIDRQQEH
jgi:hypothetical protein